MTLNMIPFTRRGAPEGITQKQVLFLYFFPQISEKLCEILGTVIELRRFGAPNITGTTMRGHQEILVFSAFMKILYKISANRTFLVASVMIPITLGVLYLVSFCRKSIYINRQGKWIPQDDQNMEAKN